jgi:hypothetical protein
MTGMQVFQLIKTRMGDREAEAMIDFVDTKFKENHETGLRTFATKEDLSKVNGSLREEIAKVKGELEVKVSDVKSDVLRWMFAFFVTMLLAILGLYFKK